MQADDYISHWFRTNMWRKLAQMELFQQEVQGFGVFQNLLFIYLLSHHKFGRRKKSKKEKRKKGKNEFLKKKPKMLKRIMHCGICKQAGHNSQFHKQQNKVCCCLILFVCVSLWCVCVFWFVLLNAVLKARILKAKLLKHLKATVLKAKLLKLKTKKTKKECAYLWFCMLYKLWCVCVCFDLSFLM